MSPTGPTPDHADESGTACFLRLPDIPSTESSTSSPRLLFFDYCAAILYETMIPDERDDESWAVVEIVGCREAEGRSRVTHVLRGCHR